MKKIMYILIAFVLAISNIVTINVYANEANELITSLHVSHKSITHGDSFKVSGTFGGRGITVREGQQININFTTEDAKVTLPKKTIEIKNKNNGKIMGLLTFSDKSATITFNEYAATLDSVEGGFDFEVFAIWDKDIHIPGIGKIFIEAGDFTDTVDVINKKSGSATEQVYSKQGVWIVNSDTPSVKWTFTFNAAKHKTSDKSVIFQVWDTLDSTMVWDTDLNESNLFVVQIGDEWKSLQEARALGFEIQFSGQSLYIKIPEYVNLNGANVFVLDQKKVRISLTAKVTDATMKNKDIEFVHNKSEVTLDGADWIIDDKSKEDRVKIPREDAWAIGVLPGELRVLKVLDGTNITLPEVSFELKRDDDTDVITLVNGDRKNLGRTVTIVTDSEGIANIKGLLSGAYTLREVKAPIWVKFDSNKKYQFNIKDDDAKGIAFKIINDKKMINISVTKEWENDKGVKIEGEAPVSVQLYQNGQKFGNVVQLTKPDYNYVWQNLDYASASGEVYDYSVKEVSEENNKIIIGDKKFKVEYLGDKEQGFKIINKEEPNIPLIPLTPAITNIKIQKLWKDVNNKALSESKTQEIQVELLRNRISINKKLILNKGNHWEGSFDQLPVSEESTLKPYSYSIKEIGENNGVLKLKDQLYEVTYEGNEHDGFKITNKEKATPDKPVVPSIPDKPVVPSVPDKPDTPGVTPDIPKKPNEPKSDKPLPKTGDGRNLSSYMYMMFASGLLAFILAFKCRRNEE